MEIPNIEDELRALLAQIPRGRVATRGGLAIALGNIAAARWVGHYLLHHGHDNSCVCHRVIRAGGVLGAYIGESKQRRLAAEGVEVRDDRVDLERFLFDDFHGTRPLQALAQLQNELAARVSLAPFHGEPEFIAGVDVSYLGAVATAAYCLVECATGRLVWAHTIHRVAKFPYITSFLTFRELPAHLELLEEVRAAGQLAPLVLVDGTGRIHPRRAGIASHLGVAARIPTVGVTKKLLCGRVELQGMEIGQSRSVVHKGETLGVAVRSARSLRPVFVSPGHGTDIESSERLVCRLFHGHRLPEPLYLADRLSRAESRRRAGKM